MIELSCQQDTAMLVYEAATRYAGVHSALHHYKEDMVSCSERKHGKCQRAHDGGYVSNTTTCCGVNIRNNAAKCQNCMDYCGSVAKLMEVLGL